MRWLIWVVIATLFGAWFFLLRPTFLGGPAGYVVVSGLSMEPTLYSGDLVVTQKQSKYETGDIVAFRVPEGEPGAGGIVIHRIVGSNAQEGFVVQGDNRNGPDRWRPKPEDIVGKLWFGVPGGSRFLLALRSPVVLATLAGGIGAFLILSGEEKKAKRPRPPPPSQAGGRRRRFPPWRLPPWRGVGLGLLLLLALLVIPFAAYRSGKWG